MPLSLPWFFVVSLCPGSFPWGFLLSQVHVTLDMFYQHIVHVYWGVVYTHHLCLCDVHLKTHSLLSSDSSCSICCSSCRVSVHMNMPSAKRRLERNSPSIFTPLFSQLNLLNYALQCCREQLGWYGVPCLTHLLILIFSLSLCRCTVTERISFRISMYTSSIPVLAMMSISLAFVPSESNAF